MESLTRFLVKNYTKVLLGKYGLSPNLENFVENNAQIKLRENLKAYLFEGKFKSENTEYFKNLIFEAKKFDKIDVKNMDLSLDSINKRLEILEDLKKELENKKETILKKNGEKKFQAKIREDLPNFDPENRQDYLHKRILERANKYKVNVHSKGKNSRVVGMYYKDTKDFFYKNIKNETRRHIFDERVKEIYLTSVDNDTRYDYGGYDQETFDNLDMDIHIVCHSHLDLGWYKKYSTTLGCKFF